MAMRRRKTRYSQRPRRINKRYNAKFVWPDEESMYYKLFQTTEPEVIVSGPYETAKTMHCMMKLHREASNNKIQALIVRKKKESLKSSVIRTYEDKILPFDPRKRGSKVRVHGGQSPRWYDYTETGSRIVLGGLSKPEDFLSGEFDVIYVNQAEELNLNDWVLLQGRCTGRAGNLPYGMIYGDCNPGPPKHWIRERWKKGHIYFMNARHKDNPWLWNNGGWTKQGKTTRARLRTLPGLLYQRGYLGLWVAAEGQVFQFTDDMIIDPYKFELQPHWRRFCSIDFGINHAFVCQWWCVTDNNEMIRYREIYKSGVDVDVHAHHINRLNEVNKETISYYVSDHQLQERRLLQRYGIHTRLADKEVITGIEIMKRRMYAGKMKYVDDAVVEIDKTLFEDGKPTSTIEEFGGYHYKAPDKQVGDRRDDIPEKKDGGDDGIDASRYGAVAEENYRTYSPILDYSSNPNMLPDYLQ